MTNYRTGEPADLLPEFLTNKATTMAVSYAVRMAMAEMLSISVISRMYGDIDAMPEHILDYMAVELAAQYYAEDLSLDRKRSIIKNAIGWKMLAGTKAAVQELIASVFGEGYITEWDQYAEGPGTPGTFDITTSAVMTPDAVERFAELISRTKNETSHLRFVSAEHDIEALFTVGKMTVQEDKQTVTNDVNIDNPDQAYIQEEHLAVWDYGEGIDETVTGMDGTPQDFERILYYACYAAGGPDVIQLEKRDTETSFAGAPARAAALVQDGTTAL